MIAATGYDFPENYVNDFMRIVCFRYRYSALCRLGFALLTVIWCSSCARMVTQRGEASYYADKFNGRRTANGEVFRQRKRTAASLTIPFGTKVKVTNLKNGRTVKVRVNDRGPYVKGRIIDLSRKAAGRLGMIRDGIAPVRLKYRQKKNQ